MYKLVDYAMISRVRLAAIPTLPDISLRFVKFANIHLLIRYCRPRSQSLIVLGKLAANSISPLTPIQSLDQRVPVHYTTTYHYPIRVIYLVLDYYYCYSFRRSAQRDNRPLIAINVVRNERCHLLFIGSLI